MTPASTHGSTIAAVAGAVVAMGVAITILSERTASEPPRDERVAKRERQPPVLELVGNHAFTTAEVRASIAADETPFVDDTGALDQDAVDREVLLVLAFYWDHGYANVKTGTPHFDSGRRAVTIAVDEGPTFTIASVSCHGELLGTEASHLAMIRTRAGMLFSRTTIANDVQTLSTFYQDRSYAYSNIVPMTKVDLEQHTIALSFEVERGKPSSFERIDVIAGTPDEEAAIRRVVTVAPGQPFNETRLGEIRRRIVDLGLSRDVAISTRRGSKDTLVVVTIEAR